MSNQPIDQCLERWHQHLRGELDGGLDELLHEDCTFYSPIVFTPQEGREITKLYLSAAGGTLGGDGNDEIGSSLDEAKDGAFRYVRRIVSGHDAMLEFETSIDGKYVNGVDIIQCDDDGMIVDFKVLIRPLQAINLVHAKMKQAIEALA